MKEQSRKVVHIKAQGRDLGEVVGAIRDAGWIVESVDPGEGCVDRLKQKDFDTLLIELERPDLTEANLLHRLRKTLPQFVCLLASETPLADNSHTYLLAPPYTRDLLLTLESAIEKQKLVWENMRIITELKRTNQKLLKMHQETKAAKEQLENTQNKLIQSEKLASMGRLAASIAHEVNHPITVIIIYARLMMEKLKDLPLGDDVKKEWQRYLDITYSEMTRCGNIVKNLLEFSRQGKPDFKSVNLSERLDHVLDLLEHKATLQQVRISRKFSAGEEVNGSPEHIDQALLALVVNGIDSMQSGGILTVAVDGDSMPDMPDCVRIEINDTGCGIPPDEIKDIFDPFYTTKQDGAGLGLSVVYNIINNHEGEITVESEVGKGTTFTVRLPRRK